MSRPGFFSIGSLTGVHVLLVDDDPASREELAAILRYCGAFLTIAETEIDALGVLGVTKPDVIVLGLPRRHRGELAFVRLLHAREAAPVTPLVVILWPNDEVDTAGTAVVQLRRPLEAWDVCRTLATLVTTG